MTAPTYPDIAAFLTAQLDREAAIATAAQDLMESDPSSNHVWDEAMWGDGPDDDYPYPRHIAAQSPLKVLADIAAKRVLVADYLEANRIGHLHRGIAMRFVLKVLAAPFADQPGYRPEWAVGT